MDLESIHPRHRTAARNVEVTGPLHGDAGSLAALTEETGPAF